jgi:KipI family sensor histidine kinase inhibitor
MTAFPRFLPAGDAGLVVELGDVIDDAVNGRVLALDAALARAAVPGIAETVPTYRSLLVLYDPVALDPDDLTARLSRMLDGIAGEDQAPPGRLWTLPVVYGGAFGEDLGAVAEAAGLSEDQVVDRHARTTYRVHMIGFQPGFAYLGGLDPVLHLPRRSDPRSRVPAGSIAIGGIQTAVFSVETPSGWQLLGRTPVRAFDPRRPEPFLLAAGDRVRFRPVPASSWADLDARAAAGEALVEPETETEASR